jgi:WD repeat-containing protein 32
MVVHSLNLTSLSRDLQGFRPNKYHRVQTGRSLIPGIEVHNRLFTAKRNRVELISDFPLQDNADMITSLDVG